jgi:putrescine aminotransferase
MRTATEARMSTDPGELGEIYRSHLNATTAMLTSMSTGRTEVSAQGCLVVDDTGQRFLDCGGHGVFLLGHRHPDIVAAVREQLERQPIHSRYLFNPAVAEAAAALARVTPPGLEYCIFLCSGAESVEVAIKLARLAGKSRLVATEGGFHGKTTGALSLTGRAAYRDPFLPLLDATHVAYGDVDAMAAVLREHPRECCVFVEPVQGEAGVRIPPPGYLKDVEQLCRENGHMLAVDEIQTGLGRLGSWWGCDADDVRPDVLLCGKTLGGGVMPVSAVVATPEVYAPLNRDPFLHSSTFANSPIMAAAASATISVLERGAVIQRSGEVGAALLEQLREVARERGKGVVADVRGSGLLLGVEFTEPGHCGEFLLEIMGQRVLPSPSANDQSTVRLTPSALISDDEQRWLLDAFATALDNVADKVAA